MTGVRATVRNGRLVLDEPTSLPEGTVLDLVLDDEGDDLDAAERAERDAAIVRAWKEAQAGQGRPARDVIDGLRAGRAGWLRDGGMPGCSLLHSSESAALPTLSTGPGAASFSLAIPNLPSFIHVNFYLQAWAVAPGLNDGNTVTSNGLECQIGY